MNRAIDRTSVIERVHRGALHLRKREREREDRRQNSTNERATPTPTPTPNLLVQRTQIAHCEAQS